MFVCLLFVCLCLCVCARLYWLHTEYQNIYSGLDWVYVRLRQLVGMIRLGVRVNYASPHKDRKIE